MPPGHEHVGLARGDRLRREHHGLEARAADLVDGQGRDGVRQSGPERCLPRGSLAGASRDYVAENHLVDRSRLDPRPRHGLFHDHGPQLGSAPALERPQELAGGHADGGNDHGFSHVGLLQERERVR